MNIAAALQHAGKRRFICEHSIYHFALYYFPQYFTHAAPEFHKEMYKDLTFDEYHTLLWIMYRDSAKTSLARFKVLHAICHGYKRNIVWVGHDKEKAGKNLRAIANQLQANKKIIEDFGQLYYEEPAKEEFKKSKPKTLSHFKTANDISVKVQTTQISTRGDLDDENRPDLYVIDDIENDKTKRSQVVTKGITNFLEELLGGIAADCHIVILANRISKRGVVSYLEKKADRSKGWKKHEVALIERGEITWGSKYLLKEEDALERNKTIKNPKKKFKSVERLKMDLGSTRFAQEYLNMPAQEGGHIVKEEWFTESAYYKSSQLFQDDRGDWYFSPDTRPAVKGEVFIAVDPAVSQKETSDDRAIVAVAHFTIKHKTEEASISKKYYLVLSSLKGKWSLTDFARALDEEKNRVKPIAIGVESQGVQEVFRAAFQQYGISTTPLKPDADKVRRLHRHVADIEYHSVLWPEDGRCDDLIQELIDFTGEPGGIDNQVDAFSYAMDMCKKRNTSFKARLL